MSGGVDSSVAAALLVEQGYEVVGMTLKLYDYGELGFDPPDGGCCSIDLINDARSVCAKLGIPHYVIDLTIAFKETVIDDFIASYVAGRTPNPCVNCNRFIKWGEMLRRADKLSCDFVATGHYARIDHSAEYPRLLKGADSDKDQSYALWGITLEALRRTLLPIGKLTKPQVREIAHKYGFINADRAESQDLCFVPAEDYAGVVRRYRNMNDPSLTPGPIYDVHGNKIGEHKGYAYYTIGQRQGLGISSPNPLYVTRINPADMSITVGAKEHLFCKIFAVADMNLLVEKGKIPASITVKIRYRHEGSLGHLEFKGDNRGIVVFDRPERAITPGQSAVFYDGEMLLGGGVIEGVVE